MEKYGVTFSLTWFKATYRNWHSM